jgi:hypothetical protein
MSMKYDLAVAYRIYPGLSRNQWLFDNKFKLTKICLLSFIEAIENLKVKTFFLLDNCPREYKELIKKLTNNINNISVEIIEYNKIGNRKTFEKQVEILLDQEYSDYIYFAEDDYFIRPKAFSIAIDFMKNNPSVDFVSLYDSLDYYSMELHKRNSMVIDYKNYSWKKVKSTCLSFLTHKNKLKETRKIFLTYGDFNYDTCIWISLTKVDIFNPLVLLVYLFKQFLAFKIYVYILIISWKQCFFGKKNSLFVPVPSLATHIDKSIAPKINWIKNMKKYGY